METEKRIGDFRVYRKVSWGITFPQRLHTRASIRKAPPNGFRAGFVHSVGVERSTLPSERFHTLGQALHGHRILVVEPPVRDGTRPSFSLPFEVPAVAVEDDRLDLLEQARIAAGDLRERPRGHPGQEPGQPVGRLYCEASAGGCASYTRGFSTAMNGRWRYS